MIELEGIDDVLELERQQQLAAGVGVRFERDVGLAGVIGSREEGMRADGCMRSSDRVHAQLQH
jgi:hypothetical protein